MITSKSPIYSLLKQFKPDLFLTQKRNSFYNKYKHGPQKITNPDPPYGQWVKEFFSRDGMRYVRDELIKSIKEPFKSKYYQLVDSNKLVKIEDFDSDEAIKRWKPVADRDSMNGFSECRLIRSQAGHALFTGVLDNRLPEDGMTMNSGFVGIIGPSAPRWHPFQRETRWDWTQFNSLEIKYRGDGRKYQIVVNTGTYTSDLEHYDSHSFFLHTRGGPYWQTLRIPFHRFIFTFKNFVQDFQAGVPRHRVKFVAVTLQDKVDGPFALEIDYIGLIDHTSSLDADTAYEGYSFPHIKWKPVSVDCPVPENS